MIKRKDKLLRLTTEIQGFYANLTSKFKVKLVNFFFLPNSIKL